MTGGLHDADEDESANRRQEKAFDGRGAAENHLQIFIEHSVSSWIPDLDYRRSGCSRQMGGRVSMALHQSLAGEYDVQLVSSAITSTVPELPAQFTDDITMLYY